MTQTQTINDTIFAPATPAGASGVAVFRLSGPHAKAALEAISGKPCPAPRMAALRILRDPVSRETIDHALTLYFAAPASFTGEDVVELHTHGGRAVWQAITETLSALPHLRLAEPGEFTRRAFINNKMDLTAAEGIADLIHAETTAQRKQALRMVEGELEQQYEAYRRQLIRSMALVEAYIDFPDEDIPDSVSQELRDEVNALRTTLTAHLADNRRGERIREGVQAIILGPPNAGKSTLMNYLAKRDVSIVSQTAGTTRDVIEVHLALAGYPLVIADTAGLRESSDEIETEGVRRALARAQNADLKIAVFDAGQIQIPDATTLAQIDEDTLIVINKTDAVTELKLPDDWQGRNKIFPLSLHTGTGVDEFLKSLECNISELFFCETSPIITRTRHRRAIEQCVRHLDAFLAGGPVELMGEELRLAVHAMASVTGRVEVDEILGEIFSSFCIGK
jgi:tRNA modification GTPase